MNVFFAGEVEGGVVAVTWEAIAEGETGRGFSEPGGIAGVVLKAKSAELVRMVEPGLAIIYGCVPTESKLPPVS